MIVVLEGTDCVGKSTLMEKLADSLRLDGFSVVERHSPRPEAEDYQDLMGFFLNGLEWQWKNPDGIILLDRWFPSGFVYDEAFRERQELSGQDAFFLEALALDHGLMYISVTAPKEKVIERLRRDNSETEEWKEKQLQQLGQLQQLYNVFFTNARRRKIPVIDFISEHPLTSDAYLDRVEQINWLIQIQKKQTLFSSCEASSPGWGSMHPKVLFLGGQASTNDRNIPYFDGFGKDAVAFSSCDSANEFFRKFLFESGFAPSEIHVANTLTSQGNANLAPLSVEQLNPSLIVIMGLEAHRAFEKMTKISPSLDRFDITVVAEVSELQNLNRISQVMKRIVTEDRFQNQVGLCPFDFRDSNND